jgi:hypothetical protein
LKPGDTAVSLLSPLIGYISIVFRNLEVTFQLTKTDLLLWPGKKGSTAFAGKFDVRFVNTFLQHISFITDILEEAGGAVLTIR